MKRLFGCGTLMLSLALIGCGEETDADADIETVTGAFSEGCGLTANADFTDAGGIDPAWTSPTTYSNPGCYKAVIVDIPSYSSTYWGPASGGAPADMDGRTQVDWADTLPTTQSACSQLWLGAYLYRWSATNQVWQFRTLREVNGGQWVVNPFTGLFECRGPSLSFHSTFTPDLIVGRAYRLQISARPQPTSSAPTRKVRVQSFRPTVIQ
jgi:hypothetical protein